MKITIVYDNEARTAGLRQGHGFSALVEDTGLPPILFDTGADGVTLLQNMRELNIDPQEISIIVISHAHGDHTGGLSEVIEINRTAEIYLPNSFKKTFPGKQVTVVKGPTQIRENIFSTGELEGVEQSLALKTDKGIFVLTGCAHPGIESIFTAAAEFGKLHGIAGGFHGFRSLKLFNSLSLICPCHCTTYKQEIRDLFKNRTLGCGVGLVIEL
jgi:7,8-dihydropterin-6-yl-methyl-4-(beta-D-ribofuranosyl)aminobenzene 5'-phosphate synthase